MHKYCVGVCGFALYVLTVMANCASPTRTGDARIAASSFSQSDKPSVVESVESWSFQSTTGRIIRTQHYRIFTTEKDPILVNRLPNFAEAALTHYRTAITPLPAPTLRLDTYLMDNRPQWVRLTLQLLGKRGDRFTQIPRGGYATRGVGAYYDLGVFDTLAIAAHEGWHQYTQRTFQDRLPIWLEEGLASFMEGHKWDRHDPIFLPWANIERFDQLRKAHASGALLSLEQLVTTSPQQQSPAGDGLVTYYAQVWALAHFLNEGDGQRHRSGLDAMLTDAAEGRFRQTLLVRLGPERARDAVSTSLGAGALLAYQDDDLPTLSKEYERFIEQIVAPGSRDRIVDGRSPIAR
jgi:Protein of unknown function (DUF1570)